METIDVDSDSNIHRDFDNDAYESLPGAGGSDVHACTGIPQPTGYSSPNGVSTDKSVNNGVDMTDNIAVDETNLPIVDPETSMNKAFDNDVYELLPEASGGDVHACTGIPQTTGYTLPNGVSTDKSVSWCNQ